MEHFKDQNINHVLVFSMKVDFIGSADDLWPIRWRGINLTSGRPFTNMV